MQDFVIYTYFASLTILFLFGSSGFFMIYSYLKYRKRATPAPDPPAEWPMVTIQLPVFNEFYVVGRLIDVVCGMDYPKDRLEIQILDDSTDETVDIVAERAAFYRECGHRIHHIRRNDRSGFKAGALRKGLETATGEFVAIFDADFIPNRDFLRKTLPWFADAKTGLVQTRWEHINADYSFMTRVQAMALDGHFVIEQQVRYKAGHFINFNGTAGIWRKSCIIDAGNWEADTLTEDLDLSYRAQLRGWKFVFLRDVTSPSELPSEINSLKAQQYRWTKGAIETARKILPMVWRSGLGLDRKIYSTLHLTGNVVFPFILLAAILNVPLIFIKHQGGYEGYFNVMAVFVFAFLGSFLFYLYSQKDVYKDWHRRILLFPLFMAGSMGLAVNNTQAVLDGIARRKTEFTRTPKFSVIMKKDRWSDKKYATARIKPVVIFEAAMMLYCGFGVVSSIYYVELAAVPFQLLFTSGFGLVAWTSIKHVLDARRRRADSANGAADEAPARPHPEDLPKKSTMAVG